MKRNKACELRVLGFFYDTKYCVSTVKEGGFTVTEKQLKSKNSVTILIDRL